MSEERSRSVSPTVVIGAILAIALAVFVFQNSHEVPVEVFFWEFEGPLWLVLLVTILVALVMIELIGSLWRARRRR
ncbi:lipopolysaccharide assembly protein LapA domain-containing protein [Actinomarinicola tropica]|uniref:DUF1049 domain-containing protein n=1 Tax=Actinomarinicola tropica TaxID=2789776 RepID=A0A5Q2RP49_9ACTN|nr:LapA family protein [Actinomarinicola tropica]QGG95877.1 DUF1049 domain-containing protein [Actinomarinicola tropica]